jgi:hypothetical protein
MRRKLPGRTRTRGASRRFLRFFRTARAPPLPRRSGCGASRRGMPGSAIPNGRRMVVRRKRKKRMKGCGAARAVPAGGLPWHLSLLSRGVGASAPAQARSPHGGPRQGGRRVADPLSGRARGRRRRPGRPAPAPPRRSLARRPPPAPRRGAPRPDRACRCRRRCPRGRAGRLRARLSPAPLAAPARPAGARRAPVRARVRRGHRHRGRTSRVGRLRPPAAREREPCAQPCSPP